MSAPRDPAAPDPAAPLAGDLPDDAFVVALACLPRGTPARLRALLDTFGPRDAWPAVRGRRFSRTVPKRASEVLGEQGAEIEAIWARAAASIDPGTVWQAHQRAGVGVATRGHASYPASFLDDLDPPAIVFSLGDPDVIEGPRVAIVGTRDCTRYGYDLARRWGHELANAGVGIVSGLALGVDGAAHAGALAAAGAPPIAVVGSGLDVVYPRRNRHLWHEVAAAGVILSEYPLGSSALGWHFPARNRLIAALADVVVVVESGRTGGAMLTVDEAAKRDVPCMAVPGPVTSPASEGTNKLLSENGLVARDSVDVLVQLGMSTGARRTTVERRAPPAPPDAAVLDAIDWQPASLEQLLLRTGRTYAELSRSLDRLTAAGWVAERNGWFERVAKGAR